MDKNLLFEYFIFKSLLHLNQDSNIFQNDLSILKSIKLLFFFSTVGNETTLPLLDEFGSVHALPLGHVISDIYSSMKSNSLEHFQFDKNGVQLKVSQISENSFESDVRNAVDLRFRLLLSANPNIFNMSAYQLVELSHKWFSWNYYYKQAKDIGQSSMEIPLDVIKNERKIYKF